MPSPPPASTPSAVWSIRDPDAIAKFRVNAPVVRRMVNDLVLAVTGQPDLARAWQSLVQPEDKIGIKISAAGGELFTTHREVVEAIVDGLVAAGHERGSIVVWDRDVGAIKSAGYRPGAEGYQLVGIEPREGYDPAAVISAPLLGTLVWGDRDYIPQRGENPLNESNTSGKSYLAKIVTSRVTKIINVPVMSDSGGAGLAGCIYNMSVPNIDNWRRFTHPGGLGASGIAEIYADPRIGPKVVLHLMDALLAGYAAGPESHPQFSKHYATLLASRDPVALDTVALQRIERWRAEAKLPPVGNRAAHVQFARAMGLGNADPKRIELKELKH